MTINWFPGHMHKARKEIAKVIDEIDAVIEVLDARCLEIDAFAKAHPDLQPGDRLNYFVLDEAC